MITERKVFVTALFCFFAAPSKGMVEVDSISINQNSLETGYNPNSTCQIEPSTSTQSEDLADRIIEDVYSSIKEAAKKLANPNQYPPHHSPSDGEEFDFIVVGAGSAGAVVANRLTEVPGWNVLLVEAGGNPSKSSEVPGLLGVFQNTSSDWSYQSNPGENYCLGMINNSCYLPRGKVLGGSSTLNFMNYVRGNAKDYNSWAESGNTGWTYEEVLPYFKKSEDMRISEVFAGEGDDKYHGRGGYLKIESWVRSEIDDFMRSYGKGFEELGYPFNQDYNGKNQTGFTKMHGTLENHRRCSTAKAFLTPIKDRTNLKVTKYSLVTKVLLDEKTITANGVEFINREGKTLTVRAKKEVILSAGAINSPQLLMLSGVGPMEHLSDLGLPVVKDLPVGENLQDHALMSSFVINFNHSIPTGSPVQDMFDFLIKGSSLLSNIGPTSYASFIHSRVGTDYPDVQLLYGHVNENSRQSITNLLRILNYDQNTLEKFVEINKKGNTLVVWGSLLRPFSRGKILLKSPNPRDNPKIMTGYFSDRRDLNTFLKVYDFIYRLVETKALKSMDAKLHEVRLDDCEVHPFRSPEYRECSLRHLTSTTHHHSGSCKMGPSWDPTAVVDPALRVVGVQGLRVVDASVMPTIISGNINAAVIMIAEKASDLIKETWK